MKRIRSDILKQFKSNNTQLIPYTHINPLIRWVFWEKHKKALNLCNGIKANKVLEFGCGAGIFLPSLSEKYSKVYAIDIDINNSKQLVNFLNLRNINLKEINGEEINYPIKTFDIIFALDVFEHFRNAEKIIYKIRKILKDDGYLIISGPTENLFYKICRIFWGHKKPKDHFYTIDKIIAKMTKLFTIEEIITVPFGLPSEMSIFKVIKAKPKKI